MSDDPTTTAAGWPYSGRCYCKREAAYVWTTQPALNDVPLCEDHCAAWRANVAAGIGNEPLRIRTVAA